MVWLGFEPQDPTLKKVAFLPKLSCFPLLFYSYLNFSVQEDATCLDFYKQPPTLPPWSPFIRGPSQETPSWPPLKEKNVHKYSAADMIYSPTDDF